jgi:hypothetical protein
LVAGQAQQGRQEVLAFDLGGIRRHLLPDGAAEHNKKSYKTNTKNYITFYSKFVTELSKIWV